MSIIRSKFLNSSSKTSTITPSKFTESVVAVSLFSHLKKHPVSSSSCLLIINALPPAVRRHPRFRCAVLYVKDEPDRTCIRVMLKPSQPVDSLLHRSLELPSMVIIRDTGVMQKGGTTTGVFSFFNLYFLFVWEEGGGGYISSHLSPPIINSRSKKFPAVCCILHYNRNGDAAGATLPFDRSTVCSLGCFADVLNLLSLSPKDGRE